MTDLPRKLSVVPASRPAALPPMPDFDDLKPCPGRWWGPYGCVDALCPIHGTRNVETPLKNPAHRRP